MNKHFRKISDFAMIGGLSALVVGVITGCDTNSSSQEAVQTTRQAVKNGAFVVLEEQENGSYKVLEEYPSATTRIIVHDRNGNERVLSDDEVAALIKQEEVKIDNGTSELVNAPSGGGEGSGMSLGSAILASAAGALLGSYIGNKLFNNPNYQQNKQRGYKSPQAYERSANSFNKAQNATSSRSGNTPSNAKSGFFGNNAQKSTTSRSTSTFGS